VILVFGGSQAVARLSAALLGALEKLLPDWRVLHLAGEGSMPQALAARDALPEALRARYRAVPFLTDEMAAALVAADLVLGRAGSSTCAEVARGRRRLDPGAVSLRRPRTRAPTRRGWPARARR